MKIDKTSSTENCHFYSHEKSLYVAWECFRNVKEHAVFFNKHNGTDARFKVSLSSSDITENASRKRVRVMKTPLHPTFI